MAVEQSALYSPYGAYELKARYQRNFMFGTLITGGFVALVLLVFLVVGLLTQEEIVEGPVHIIKTVAELGPPPTIAKKPPQVKVNQPNVAAPKVGIPKPVADDEVLDDDVTLATREELAEIVAPDIAQAAGQDDIVVDIADDDYLPALTDFVAVEVPADLVYRHEPTYPRLAEQAGITGEVAVKVLVDKNGNARDAVVFKSSGNGLLDEAAVEAAKQCRFKPAIQNGRPVAMWVAFTYEFIL
ncbi:MAG: energy transducer TonB [Candidatus Zixiibacteriota bacterium]|nr:MAG: energy transducer TonB [candidate division Zixibacteria bacterium]